jgi:putative restriction endonuclease
MSKETAARWLARLERLRVDVDAAKGRAPHKPLLLLAVLELLETGRITDGWVNLEAELVLRFQNYWPIVQSRRDNKGDVRMPFHALGTDGVWAVFDHDGRPSRARVTSVRARLPDDLLILLGDAPFRARLRLLLVTTYFPADEQVALFAALGFEGAADTAEIQQFAEETPDRYRIVCEVGRSARFKTTVVSGYRFACALTGYRLTTAEQAGIVEAAHIHALSSSRNNDPDNGLALTPTAHALFDLGLWSVTDDLRVLVKPEAAFVETSPPGGFGLRALHNRPLHLDPHAKLRPGTPHLAWHRRHHGFSKSP